MAASTLSLVCGLTLGCELSTRETVWCETPARRATSAMTGGLDLLARPGAIARLPGLPAPMGVPGSAGCASPARAVPLYRPAALRLARIVTAHIESGQPRKPKNSGNLTGP